MQNNHRPYLDGRLKKQTNAPGEGGAVAAGMSPARSGAGDAVPPAPALVSGDSVTGEPTAVGEGAVPTVLTGVGDGVVPTPPADEEAASESAPVGATYIYIRTTFNTPITQSTPTRKYRIPHTVWGGGRGLGMYVNNETPPCLGKKHAHRSDGGE